MTYHNDCNALVHICSKAEEQNKTRKTVRITKPDTKKISFFLANLLLGIQPNITQV